MVRPAGVPGKDHAERDARGAQRQPELVDDFQRQTFASFIHDYEAVGVALNHVL